MGGKVAVFFPALVLFFLALTPLHAAATEYNCSSCSDCSTKIQAASPGDIVNLNTSINSSSCIQFSSASSVTFDCNNFNITGAGSGGTGIYIRDRYNIIRNCYLSLFERGIYLSYSQFSPDGYNLITNNTLFNNTNGIYILSMSAYDTFTNNKFYNNTYAIYIWLSNQGYGENYFYNNIFSNNTYHFENNYYDIHNYFNTTLNCSAGPNIIGGDCIGGNYWTSPSGNFSDTCTDLFAPYGICDDIHSMGSFWQDGFDYLPLVQRYTYPCDSCSDCSTKIQAASPGDAFYLNTTITNHSGNCIEFGGADGVTFRCDVPLIEGDGDSDGYGIFLSDSSVNNTIMGCSNISLFSIGVFVNQSDNNTIINVTANENIGYGMKIEANNITIMDCNTTNNDHPTLDSAYGIYMIGNYNKIDNTYSEGNDGTDAVSPTSYGIWFSGNYSEIVDIVTKNNEPAGGTSSLGYGIYLEHSNNNTIADIVSLNSSYAHLYLNYSDNNTIYSITANYSGENGVGVYSYSSDWNNFTDITSSYHGNIGLGAGFYFDGCSNNIINYLISTDNSGYGIQFANSHNNTIVNSTLSSNSKEAIMLLSCSDNNISSTTMSDNLFGITFYSQNSNNIISNSNIKNSTSYGIYFYENGTGVSSNNFIYNNLFNNTINVYSNNESAFNYFNTTLDYFNSQSAINGSCLGGNFWTGPNGNFSDNCTDTASDGICDSDYTLQTNITDYLPLTIQRNYICNSCSRCSSMVQWASSYGGLVNLNATITNQSGTCISSTYANNVIFDCNGFVISGDSVGYDYGFYFDNYYDRHNLTIRNCPNISYFYSGISIGLRLIDYINISNVSLYNNSHGIYIDCKSQLYSPLFVENIHASNNGLSGFRTSQCSGMRITDSVFDNNEKGMEFGYINDNSTISNITVTNNSDTGIYLRCADNNTFTDSRILNNTYGVKFVSCGAYSDINTFYNNIFNNTINVLDYYNSNHTNYFNTTLNCSAGSNIIGGDCVGGNFWTDSDGNFSDTCSDDNSPYGICDSSYTPQTNNTDYLPLMQEYVTSCQDCSDCSTKIQAASPGDIVYLNTSITGQSGSCIEFSDADGVIFDCNGLVINGDNSGFDYGIDTSSNSDNNTIRNCPNISGFAYGVYVYQSNNNTVDSVIASDNLYSGVRLFLSHNNTVANSTFRYNPYDGIWIYGSSGNTLRNNTIETRANDSGLFILPSTTSPTNDIDTSNTVDGKPVKHFDGYYTSCPDNQILDYNNTYSQLVLIGCDNVTVRNSEFIDSIFMHNTNNSVIENVNCSYSHNGMFIEHSHNNLFSLITITDNKAAGMYLEYSDNNVISGISAGNNYYGISVSLSENNTISNITATNNRWGFTFGSSCLNNTVKNSRIEDNTDYGIFLNAIGSEHSKYNTFYNNIFSNTINIYSNNDSNQNYWNITKTSGTNIVGGPYISGNYWSDPDGNFSDTCIDSDHDWICDINYTSVVNNTDFLPLTICTESWSCTDWTMCVGTVQERTCADTNSCGTVNIKPVLHQFCDLGGGDSGSGVVVPPPEVTHSFIKIEPGAEVTISIEKEGLDFSEINVLVTNQANDVSITITKLNNKPAVVGKEVRGRVYQYVQIKKTNLEDENIEKVRLKFKVKKSWLDSNNLDKDTVLLERYTSQWTKLPTFLKSEDSDYVYYEAETPGFSYFAITAEENEESGEHPSDIFCGNGECDEGEDCNSCSKDCDCVDEPLIGISTGVIGERAPSGVYFTTSMSILAFVMLMFMISMILLLVKITRK